GNDECLHRARSVCSARGGGLFVRADSHWDCYWYLYPKRQHGSADYLGAIQDLYEGTVWRAATEVGMIPYRRLKRLEAQRDLVRDFLVVFEERCRAKRLKPGREWRRLSKLMKNTPEGKDAPPEKVAIDVMTIFLATFRALPEDEPKKDGEGVDPQSLRH